MVDSLAQAKAIAQSVADPELPFLTVQDLGILRSVKFEHGVVIASVAPTYSGCPAVRVIEQAVQQALEEAGFVARVERVLNPPWSTEWITTEGRRKLLDNGIAPPHANESPDNTFFAVREVQCPHCTSVNTEKVSEFGSTPCKAQYRCKSCLEPFDHFKCH